MVTKNNGTVNFQLGAFTGSVVRAVADQKQFGELRGYGTVGGSEQPARFRDPLANDQDWSLVYYLRHFGRL